MGNLTATDNSGNVLWVSCDPKSGTNCTIKQSTFICVAVDDSGNRAEYSVKVNVISTELVNNGTKRLI